MKKLSIAATALAVALCALPMAAACDNGGTTTKDFKVNGKKFNVADYALSLEDSSKNYEANKALTSYAEKNFSVQRRISSRFALVDLHDEEKTGYQLYDFEKEATVRSSVWYTGTAEINGDNYAWNSSTVFFGLTTTETEKEYFTPTGELVTTDEIIYTPYVTRYLFHNEEESTYTYRFSYVTESDEADLYFAYTQNTKTKETTWAKIDEEKYEEFYEVEDDELKVGDSLGLEKQPLVNEKRYPDYIYKNYSYTEEGNLARTRTFYNGDKEIGSFTYYGNQLGYLGKYFYYYEKDAVSADAKSGYNYETTDDGATVKTNYRVYRYNFTKGGKAKEVKLDFLPDFESPYLVFNPFYNNTTNDFDLVQTSVYKLTNGVAVDGGKTYLLLLDVNLKVSADVTAKGVSTLFYKLSETRFLSGRTILDEKLNTVAQLPSEYDYVRVWEEQELIVAHGYNYGSGYAALFVDFDGKVALPPFERCGGAVGGTVFALNEDGDLALFTTTNTNGTTVDSLVSVNEDEGEVLITDYLLAGLLIKRTTDARDDSYTTYTYTVYDLAGNKLGTVANATVSSFSPTAYGETYVVSFTTRDTDNNFGYKTVILK